MEIAIRKASGILYGTPEVGLVALATVQWFLRVTLICEPQRGQDDTRDADSEFLQRPASRDGLRQAFGEFIEFVVHSRGLLVSVDSLKGVFQNVSGDSASHLLAILAGGTEVDAAEDTSVPHFVDGPGKARIIASDARREFGGKGKGSLITEISAQDSG